jgi:TonB-dependent SusC/RagA subfamily outer membrane receptor
MHGLLRRYPGVAVTTEGGGLHLRIRGARDEPLYVLDGLPLAPGDGAVLTAVHPCDVQEIRVVRDAAELASYGVRGANGVVLISTRRP